MLTLGKSGPSLPLHLKLVHLDALQSLLSRSLHARELTIQISGESMQRARFKARDQRCGICARPPSDATSNVPCSLHPPIHGSVTSEPAMHLPDVQKGILGRSMHCT
eukprot:848793-Amphidinium_carterae.1